MSDAGMSEEVGDREYQELLRFRDGLRRFLHWSAQRARAEGLTPMQHQLLLAIRGHEDGDGPTIRNVADHLLLRHHSVVELIDRAVAAGLVVRERPFPGDGRSVRLRLTPLGEAKLGALTALHVEELGRFAARIGPLWEELGVVEALSPASGDAGDEQLARLDPNRD
jgi:DNA-binding MarR family transcriptional regulator